MNALHFRMAGIGLGLLLVHMTAVYSQSKKATPSLTAGNNELVAVNVTMTDTVYKGRKALKVSGNTGQTEASFVKLSSIEFNNGTIQLEMAGVPGSGASATARGFVGLAFRIDEKNEHFECFYLRPTNGRADDQVRRNHSLQYISFPDHPWYKLREEFPEKYESYADLVPGDWTKVRIEVKGAQARLFLHGQDQPSLIVNDLKMGTGAKGSIGLWIGPGTDAHFTKLVITPE